MYAVRRLTTGLVALVTVAAGLAMPAGSAVADPAGTRLLNANPTDRPSIRILGASGAGLLYQVTNRDYGWNTERWVKPAGAAAFRLGTGFEGYDALSGSLLFDLTYDGQPHVTYRTISSTTTRTCAIGTSDELAYLPTGWLAHNRTTDAYTLVTAASAGCATQPVTTIANSRLLTADASGFAVEVTTNVGNGGVHELRYVPFADPAHPRLADSDDYVYNLVTLANGVLAWPEVVSDYAPYRFALHRWSASGGATTPVPLDYAVVRVAVTGTVTAFVGCDFPLPDIDCVAGTVPAGGSTVSTLPATTDVAASGATVYFARWAARPGIDSGASAAAQLTRVVTPPLMLPGTWRVSLGASRSAYVDTDGDDSDPYHQAAVLHWRYAAKSGGSITLGTAYNGGKNVTALDVDGRRQLVGVARADTQDGGDLWLRTEGAPAVRIFQTAPRIASFQGGPVTLSGTRALWFRSEYTGDGCGGGCPQYGNRSAMLYDVRTGASTRVGEANTTKWALWGSYLAWATRDGSIYRKDLSSGKVLTVKYKGYGVVGLGVWGSYVGWSECVQSCYKGNVAYRNLATGTATVRVATPVVALAVHVTGGHVVYYIGTGPARGPYTVRELRIGSTATATIAPVHYSDEPAQVFDAQDEVLSWVGRDGLARIAPNSAYTDPPKYLGNALGSASFTPNGDGHGDTWTPEFPVSKALPTCQVVIRSRTGTVLRRLNCPTSTGSARVVWNGRLASGALVPKGTYSWTLTGSDSDGTLRWWNGSTAPIHGTVTVA